MWKVTTFKRWPLWQLKTNNTDLIAYHFLITKSSYKVFWCLLDNCVLLKWLCNLKNSLAVQLLELSTSTPGGLGSTPGQGTASCMVWQKNKTTFQSVYMTSRLALQKELVCKRDFQLQFNNIKQIDIEILIYNQCLTI